MSDSTYVRCIEPYEGRLTKGKDYRVVTDYGSNFYSLIDDNGQRAAWFKRRFEILPAVANEAKDHYGQPLKVGDYVRRSIFCKGTGKGSGTKIIGIFHDEFEDVWVLYLEGESFGGQPAKEFMKMTQNPVTVKAPPPQRRHTPVELRIPASLARGVMDELRAIVTLQDVPALKELYYDHLGPAFGDDK